MNAFHVGAFFSLATAAGSTVVLLLGGILIVRAARRSSATEGRTSSRDGRGAG